MVDNCPGVKVVQGEFFGGNCLEGKTPGIIVQAEISWGQLSGRGAGSYPAANFH